MTKPPMTVTIAICTWNRADSLEATLHSLRALDVPPGTEWEVVVVNNACSDATDDVINSYRASLPIRRLFEARPGQSAARNCAVRSSDADILLWTDDDVIVDPGWLKSILAAFGHWNADLVFGRSVPQWTTGAPDWFSPLHYGRFAILDYGAVDLAITGLLHQFYGLNFAVRRDALLAVGGFDETLGYTQNGGAAGEDTDLYRRAVSGGLKVVYTPHAVIHHVIPAVRTTKQFYRRRLAAAAPRNYAQLREAFPDVPWLAGLPRFMFRQAVSDGVGFLHSLTTRAHDRTFDYELRLRTFLGYLRAAHRGTTASAEVQTQ